jgi:hypothetical protein
MGKFNLSEAAKEILGQTTSKMGSGDKFGQGKKLAADEQGREDIGGPLHTKFDKESIGKNAAKTVGQATPPGATPPVGQQKDGVGRTKVTGPQDNMGRSDLRDGPDADNFQSRDSTRDRQPAPKMRKTFAPNPGAPEMYCPEENDYDDEDPLDEAKCDDEEGHEDEAQDKKKMRKKKMKEDIDALLQGENLSEEFVSRASTIFEAAVIARAEEVIAEAEEELTEQFELAVEEIKNDLAEKVDGYLGYMVEEWMKENELAIERGLRAEIVEDFIGGLRDLFTEHYIDIPSEKVDVAEELAARVEELEDALNEQINRNVEMNKDLNEQRKLEAIYTACEGLTQTQVEKLKALAEGVEYSDEFADKLDVLKESYFKVESKAPSYNSFDDEVVIEEERKTKSFISEDPMIAQYAKTISQTLIK